MGAAFTDGVINDDTVNVEPNQPIAWNSKTSVSENVMLAVVGPGSHDIGHSITNEGYTILTHMNDGQPGMSVKAIGDTIENKHFAIFALLDEAGQSPSSYQINVQNFRNNGAFLIRGTGDSSMGDMHLGIRTSNEFNNQGFLAIDQFKGAAQKDFVFEHGKVAGNSGTIRVLNTRFDMGHLQGCGCIAAFVGSQVTVSEQTTQTIVLFRNSKASVVVKPKVAHSGSGVVSLHGLGRDHEIVVNAQVREIHLNKEILTAIIGDSTELKFNLGYTDKYKKEKFQLTNWYPDGIASTVITYTEDSLPLEMDAPPQCPHVELYTNLGLELETKDIKDANDLKKALMSIKQQLPP